MEKTVFELWMLANTTTSASSGEIEPKVLTGILACGKKLRLTFSASGTVSGVGFTLGGVTCAPMGEYARETEKSLWLVHAYTSENCDIQLLSYLGRSNDLNKRRRLDQVTG
jgi:hypothetical protein